MILFNLIAASSVLCTSFIASHPAEAFTVGMAADKNQTILGTWECTFEVGGKIVRGDPHSMSFRRDGGLRMDLHVNSMQLHQIGTWEINGSKLIMPRGAKVTIKNVRTGEVKRSRAGKTWYNDILTLTNTRLIFEREGGGDMYNCRK